jgi:hypothetical protein
MIQIGKQLKFLLIPQKVVAGKMFLMMEQLQLQQTEQLHQLLLHKIKIIKVTLKQSKWHGHRRATIFLLSLVRL